MPNFFTDNQDIQFLLNHYDLKEIAALQERETLNGDADYVPRDLDDVIDNYKRVLTIAQIFGMRFMRLWLLNRNLICKSITNLRTAKRRITRSRSSSKMEFGKSPISKAYFDAAMSRRFRVLRY